MKDGGLIAITSSAKSKKMYTDMIRRLHGDSSHRQGE